MPYIEYLVSREQGFKQVNQLCNFVGLLHHPLLASAALGILGITFQRFKLICLARIT